MLDASVPAFLEAAMMAFYLDYEAILFNDVLKFIWSTWGNMEGRGKTRDTP